MKNMMKKYPCTYMRGGTSKAVFFKEKDLPENKEEWPELFLKVMGSPDIKQIDGLGGATSSTSKVAVISPSECPEADVNYNFFQVDIVIPNVDNSANCGNIAAAVGAYAVDEKMVKAKEPVTVVRVYNVNTGKIIEEHVRVKDGRAMTCGNAKIEGVPGTGSPIEMFFLSPAGSKTGRLFPTGQKKEMFQVGDYPPAEVTVLDCANPVLFVHAEDLGIRGSELTELNENKELMEHIEALRGKAAEKLHFVEHWQEARFRSTSIPKVAVISKSQDYTSLNGEPVLGEHMDLCIRAVSVGAFHKAIPLTVAAASGAAALIPGTIVHSVAGKRGGEPGIRLGHASGISEVKADMDGEQVIKAGIVRTARRILDGYVYIRE